MNGNPQNPTWSIVLAGGEGERIRPLVTRWLGRHKPKQYCKFTGNRSMLEHTLDRADRISSPERKVTIIARSHRSEASAQLMQHASGIVVEQPVNRDTAAGIFLPLSIVRAREPNATIVVYPSDLFVYPEERFVEAVSQVVGAVEKMRGKLILLGVTPDGLELDYGWILPGQDLCYLDGCCVRAVEGFCEKPGFEEAKAVLDAGGLWNTLIFAAKVETLWKMGWRYVPEIMPQFEDLCSCIDALGQPWLLDEIYSGMPKRNFSSDLLTRAIADIAVVQMDGVRWSDWGRPERIVSTLSEMGKQPAFPLQCLG
ncbi:MAG: putative Mannose-1-phosphate guanylyltransferase [Acidobacteria bacterium]|nr:putative Mannose-1-phosphate guanylyltransferase [Acidobacteriota bacterium]